jgi:hypothetical protein
VSTGQAFAPSPDPHRGIHQDFTEGFFIMRKFAVRRIVLAAVAGIVLSATGAATALASTGTLADGAGDTTVTTVATPSDPIDPDDSQPWT